MYIVQYIEHKYICIPKSFNINILQELLVYKITLVNSQHEKTNSKGDLVLKIRVKTFVLKISGIQQ